MLIIQRKTLTHHVSKQKKTIADSIDSFQKHVANFFHASFIAFIIFCSRVKLHDWNLYMFVAKHEQSTLYTYTYTYTYT
jgi:hypothetical protein